MILKNKIFGIFNQDLFFKIVCDAIKRIKHNGKHFGTKSKLSVLFWTPISEIYSKQFTGLIVIHR